MLLDAVTTTGGLKLVNIGIGDAGLAALTGYALIFSGMIALMLVIMLIGKVFIAIEKRKEVPVEVPPTGEFCNIPMHRIWPVLFFISLALNVTLAAVIVVYIRNKKKNQHDDTPLVDYDIFDDTF